MALKDDIYTKIDAVQTALEGARTSWNSAGNAVSDWLGADGGGRANNLAQLAKTYGPAIEKWQARGRSLANGGAVQHAKGAQWALDAWTDEGNDLLTNLERVSNDTKFSRLDRMILDTVVASAQDVGHAAAVASTFLRKRWLLIAVGAAVLLVLIYLPGVRRALFGGVASVATTGAQAVGVA